MDPGDDGQVMALARVMAERAWAAVGGDRPTAVEDLVFTGSGGLPSVFPVSDLAAAAIATAALSVSEFIHATSGKRPPVTVDRRLSSMWFGFSIRPIGWRLPAPWDSIAGDYPTRDGWIRLHTNAPHHRAAVERVLGAQIDREGTARAVAPWAKTDLETAVVESGGCAAEMQSASPGPGRRDGSTGANRVDGSGSSTPMDLTQRPPAGRTARARSHPGPCRTGGDTFPSRLRRGCFEAGSA